jgi:hypothetical protein
VKKLLLVLAVLFLALPASAQQISQPYVTAARPTALQLLQASAGGTTWAPVTLNADVYAGATPGQLYVQSLTGASGNLNVNATVLKLSASGTTIQQQGTLANGVTQAAFALRGSVAGGSSATGGDIVVGGGGGTLANGNVVADLGTIPGSAESYLTLRRGGSTIMQFGATQGASSFDSIYFGGVTPSTTNYGFLGNATTSYLNATSQVNIAIGGTALYGFTSSSGLSLGHNFVTFGSALTGPQISQGSTSTPSATGAPMTVASQSATGATSIGGELDLNVGTGTSANGNAVINLGTHPTGAYNYAKINQNGATVGWLGQWPNTGASYGLWLGTPTPTTSNFALLSDNFGDVALNGASSLSLEAANSVMASVTQTAILVGAPILGGAVGVSNTSPFGVHGERSIALTVSRALTNTEYDAGRNIFTGTGSFTVTYPAVASNLASYGKWITNNATATLTVGDGGTNATVASGVTSFVWFDASGATVLK